MHVNILYIYTFIIRIFCLHPDPQHKISIWAHENDISPTPRCFPFHESPNTKKDKVKGQFFMSCHDSLGGFNTLIYMLGKDSDTKKLQREFNRSLNPSKTAISKFS